MKRLVVLLLLTASIFCSSQTLIVRQIDSAVSSYNKIPNANLIVLTNLNDQKLPKEFGITYKFRKADKKLLEINVFPKKEPSYIYWTQYYEKDSLIKVTVNWPKGTFRQFYYRKSRLIYTNDKKLVNPSPVFLRGGTELKLRAYKYLKENSSQ
jgi:hypothetical protein